MSPPLPGQLSFFDAEEGERLREASIERAQGGAPVVALVEAVGLVRRLAETRRDFTTDAVWVRLEALRDGGGMTFPEPRAMGAVMRIAEREGYVAPTEEHRLSRRPVCHRRPIRVWASRIFRGRGAVAA